MITNNISWRLIGDRAHRDPGSVLHWYRGVPYTVGELWNQSRRAATTLREIGLRPRQRLIYVCDDGPQWSVFFHAMIMSGIIPVVLNPRLTTESMINLCQDAGTDTILGNRHFLDAMPLSNKIPIEDIDYSASDTIQSPHTYQNCEIMHMVSSSGTTGSHRLIAHGWQNVETSFRSNNPYGLAESDVILHTARFGSNWGITLNIWGALIGEFSTVILESPTDFKSMDRVVKNNRVTNLFVTPSHIKFILNHPKFDFGTTLNRVWSGSEVLPRVWHEEFERRYGIYIHQLYGFSENQTGWSALINAHHCHPPRESIGGAVANHEYRFHHGESFDNDPSQGELMVRADCMFLGYWKHDNLDSGMIQDGWYNTGDIMSQDSDGFFYFHGRVNQRVRIKNNWVNLIDIESFFEKQSNVDLGVVTVDIDHTGNQFVHAYLKPKHLIGIDYRSVRPQVSKKIPLKVSWVNDIPVTAANKKIRQPRVLDAYLIDVD